MFDRRSFLFGSLAGMAALAAPRVSRGAVSAADRKFMFVFAEGGWDPTRVFVDGFDLPGVAMEAQADRATTAGLPWVDHPDRPSVRAFMQAHASRTLLFNGVLVRSIAHEICRVIAMTGDSAGTKPDWPSILADAGMGYTVPHLVLGGPSFPGPLGASVARTGSSGQLESLVSGDITYQSDDPQLAPPLPSQSIVDDFARRRSAAQALRVPGGQAAALYAAYDQATHAATELKNLKFLMDFTGGATLAEQAEVAVDALAIGMSRCVSMSAGGVWDTHDNNDPMQSSLFESTFAGLNQLMELLQGTPGSSAPTLAEETTVVVLSEMGRTPALNGFLGKDHWPYTSVMIVSDGVTGGRVVGGMDDLFYGQPVDPKTGDVSAQAPLLSAESVGATLLALADLDPGEFIQGVDPIEGVLS